MAGIAEYAFESGISDVISVVDPAMDRILKRCDNAPYGYIGKTVQMGKTKALAALSDITEERIARIRAFAGITGEIFLEDDVVADALAESTPVTMPVALRDYCDAQIAGACTDSEREAALALQRELAGMYRSHPSCDA